MEEKLTGHIGEFIKEKATQRMYVDKDNKVHCEVKDNNGNWIEK